MNVSPAPSPPSVTRVTCRHHGRRRWQWTTADAATGEVCDECLRAVVLGWPDIQTLVCVS